MKKLIYIFILCVSILHPNHGQNSRKVDRLVCEKILKELLVASGKFSLGEDIPVKIDIAVNFGNLASFVPKDSTIYIEKPAFDIAMKIGSSALAYLIGHELHHYFQKQQGRLDKPTKFAALHDHNGGYYKLETEADIRGAMYAYLAGYKIQDTIRAFVDAFYDSPDYNFNKSDCKGKPGLHLSYCKRREIADSTENLLQEWVQVYEAAQWFSIIEEYQLARICYQHIIGELPVPSLYNNLGITYILEALNCSDENETPYLFPFEMEWKARFAKPPSNTKSKSISFEDNLSEAVACFEKAREQAPSYGVAVINLTCTKILLGKPDEAICIYNDHNCGKYKQRATKQEKYNFEKGQLVFGVALLDQKKIKKAKDIFEELLDSDYAKITILAQYYLSYLEDRTLKPDDFNCQLAPHIVKYLDNLDDVKIIGNTKSVHGIEGSYISQFTYKKTGWNSVVNIHVLNKKIKFGVQKFPKLGIDPTLNVHDCILPVQTKDGHIFHSHDKKLILHVDTTGRLIELVKYSK